MHIFYLYKITDLINNKIYIGQTVNPKRRWRDHKWLALNKQEQYIHRAMNKYGISNFTFETIASCLTQNDADETERLIIQQYDSRNKEKGYNISPGGEFIWNKGLPKEQQPMFGKKQSEYQKQRMSEIHSGKEVLITEETKKKMSDVRRGRPKSEKWKKNISDSNKGIKRSECTKKRISESKKGNTNRQGTCKFSEDQQNEIVLLSKSGLSACKIAKIYNCNHPTIIRILKRKLI